jgi:TfoX/Sxy family transcriptional regulator of competence genes
MASDREFVDYVMAQSRLGSDMTCTRMFGEYALYVGDKVVGFVCDNQVYLKPTDAGRAMLGTVSEHPPYPGAKRYFRLDAELDEPELLQNVFLTTAQALPPPKPKRKPAGKTAKTATSRKVAAKTAPAKKAVKRGG